MNTDTYTISVSKDDIAKMPTVSFTGQISVIDSSDKVDSAVMALSKAKIIGFDTETKPSFRKGKINKPALIQLSTEDHCYLFRINKTGISDSLLKLLENPDIVKVGLSVHDDVHVINRITEFTPQGFIDIQSLVHNFNISDISLQKVYGIIFGMRISKGQRLTNWEAEKLTEQQLRYAALDAWACLHIYKVLSSGEFHPENSPYKVPLTPTES